MMKFTGFTPEGLNILIENRAMNSSEFYEANKEKIQTHMVRPFYQLCEAMTPQMLQIDPFFVTIPYRMVSRVRRDTRYTKDKTLYRANLWLYFRRKREPFEEVPFFYFELGPDAWKYGCWGCFGKGEMDAARQMILQEDVIFLQAYRQIQQMSQIQVQGDCYRRIKYPDANPDYQGWLNRKHIGFEFVETEDFSSIFDGSFLETVLQDFQKLAPVYHFLQTAQERAKLHRGEGGV